jgi:hypothetical protein
MRRLVLFATFVSLWSALAVAQVVEPDTERPTGLRRHVFGLGLWGGPATGIGLSFRHHLPSAFSYMVTGGIIKTDEKLSAAAGGEVQFDVRRTETVRIYLAGGAGYYYAGDGTNELESPFRAAFGVGGELSLGMGFHGMLDLVFTYFSNGTVLPLPQAGLHYYFE